MLEQGEKNRVIIDAAGIKRSQLTNYEKVIRQGKLEELRFGTSIRKLIAENRTESPLLNPQMIAEIEREPRQDIKLEYFVDGERKFYVPSHHLNLIGSQSIEMLRAENMILRYKIWMGMGARIQELEKNEIILKSENERLMEQIKFLEKLGTK